MRDERPPIGLGSGLAGAILVIIIAWALAAVLMLTGTLTNARQINKRVKLVNAQVDPIDKNLAFVSLAARTGRISAKIRVAAQHLSGELDQVLTVAGRIDNKAASILGKARSINGVVTSINAKAHAINANAHAINTSANSINTSVHSIGANVQSISTSVASIGGRVDSIHSRVGAIEGVVGPVAATNTSINGNVTTIRAQLGDVRSTAQGIRSGVVDINNHADAVTGLVRALKGDFDNILSTVGTNINSATILGHANSIDCSRLINFSGPTQACNK